MILPRSPAAVFGFFEAQNGLGESPGGSNNNFLTKAANLDGQPWCAIGLSVAFLAAGFNETGSARAYGSPAAPPAWVKSPLPAVAGLGFGSTYRWGSAYTWAFRDAAIAAGRWHNGLDDGQPGDVCLINHNGRGKAHDSNSHTCLLIRRLEDGSFLTWNANLSDQIMQARWLARDVEGFARPNYVSQPAPPTQEDFLVSLTPAQQAEMYESLKATNAAVGRLEVVIEDHTNGMQKKLDDLIAKLSK